MSSWRDNPSPVADEEILEEYSADVVVVGLGFAGTAAARAAVESGVSVIGIEQMTREHYTCFGRDIGHINSRFLQSRGVPFVDPIDLFNEMMRRAYNRANPSLVMKFAQNCGSAFDWFTDMYGIDGLHDVRVAFWPEGAAKFKADKTHEYNGYHFWNGTAQFPDPRGWSGKPSLVDIVNSNFAAIERNGGTLLFGMEAVQPVLREGKMSGVICRAKDGTYVRVNAGKSIVLAAGGFGGNAEMYKELVSDCVPRIRMGRKGRGIQLGVWAGGQLESRPLPIMDGDIAMNGFTSFGILWLDRDGNRFCNENFGGPEIAGNAFEGKPEGTYYFVFDEHILEDLQWAFPAHQGFDESDPNLRKSLDYIIKTASENPKGVKEPIEFKGKGLPGSFDIRDFYSGNTPEELAENAGLEGKLAERFAGAIRRYNCLCENGRDDDFGKEPKLLRPLSGRLFLQKTRYSRENRVVLATVGGLVTDENQNVLNEINERIQGLYATGNCCGRRFGPLYTTPIAGVSISMAITLGREAGKSASQCD